MIPLAQPDIGETEIQYVTDVLRSGTLSMGRYVDAFEAAVARRTGNRFAIAVSSGTAGLQTVLAAWNLGPGDEVVTTPFSFVASANVILLQGAQPVFVDIEPETYNLDPDRIEAAITPRTKAILPVDVFGHPAALEQIREVASRHGLRVLEDACESLGSTLGGRPTGHPAFCDAAVFAFYPNKQITTGEGGLIVTSDEALAETCRSLRNQGRGRDGEWLHHVRLGFNFRMDELSAAVGVAQLERLDAILAAREAVAAHYTRRLQDLPGVRPPAVRPGVRLAWFVYVVLLDRGIDRDRVAKSLSDQGVPTRPYFAPIHLQPYYRSRFGWRPGAFPVTEDIGSRTLALPFFTRMAPEQVDYVADALARAINSAS